MNKRDFYKELMSEYMFDKDRICANAKKGRFAGRKSLPIYVGMTAAVAAVVVVAGTAAFTLLDSRNAVLIGDNVAGLPYSQRIERAVQDIIKNANNKEEVDLLVTFTKPVSPAMARSILTGYSGGSIPTKKIYMADGTVISATNEIGTVFKNNSGEIAAALIHCAGCLSAKIQENEYVYAVEFPTAEDLKNDNLKPINIDNDPPPVNLPPVVSDPIDNTSSDNSSTSEPVNPGIGDNTHKPDVDDPVRNPEDPDPDNTTSDPDNNSSNTSNPSNSSGTSNPSTSTSEPPVVDKNRLPDGVKLPVKASKPSYITDDIGAQKAYFLNENVFYVKTENAVKLYKFDGAKETLAAEQEIKDAKVTWVSSNGLRLMVSGTVDGVRRKLFIVDAKNCTINDMHIGEMLGEAGVIAEAAYNENSDLFVLNVLDDNSKYIFTANLSGYDPINAQIVAYGSEYMSVLAARGSTLYYSEISGGTSVVYRTGELENTVIKALDSISVSTTNPAFTHALVVCESGASIFDPETESMIAVEFSEGITFGASAHSFSDGNGCFTVSSGAIVPEERISEIAGIDFTRSFSSKYAAVVSNGSVKIAPSVYTSAVKSAGVTFVRPAESAAPEQREAVDSAIGVINVIASGSCKECGIDTNAKLTDVIGRCFGDNAAKSLTEACGIDQGGELKYSSGSLSQITAADTVLVMDSETAGKLYIKAGTFEGKTGYIVKDVALVNKDGYFKLDSLI